MKQTPERCHLIWKKEDYRRKRTQTASYKEFWGTKKQRK